MGHREYSESTGDSHFKHEEEPPPKCLWGVATQQPNSTPLIPLIVIQSLLHSNDGQRTHVGEQREKLVRANEKERKTIILLEISRGSLKSEVMVKILINPDDNGGVWSCA